MPSPSRSASGRSASQPGHIPDAFIEQVLERVDCVDLIGRFVELKKAGHDYAGLCPFHSEKSPSFTVSPVKQFYHCFGCGENGDAIRFLEKTQGLSFRDAVEELARQAGMTMPAAAPLDARQARARAQALSERAACVQANAAAAGLFQRLLDGPGRPLAYLQTRQMPLKALRERYIIGYAPAQWHALRDALPGYDRERAPVMSGLVIEDEDTGRRHDRFRDRVMFGIRNLKGEIVGFGGRALGDVQPKYLNSPETPAFDKSRELYGIFEARQAIQAKGFTVLVEGYMDVLALAGAGFDNAAATMGTACTPEHLRLLLRLAPRLVFCFDGDAAGLRAAWKALQTALPLADDQHDFRFLLVPSEMGKDPDDVIRMHGADAFGRLLAQALPLSQYIEQTLRQRHGGLASLEDRARFAAEAQRLLELMPRSNFGRLLRESLLGAAGSRPSTPSPTRASAAPARSAGSVVPRAGRTALYRPPPDPAQRAIQALAQAMQRMPATARSLSEQLVALLEPSAQDAFIDGRLEQLPPFELPMWQALRAALVMPQPVDLPDEHGGAQRDLLLAAPQALASARQQYRKKVLATGLRRGDIDAAEFMRAALQEPEDATDMAAVVEARGLSTRS